MIIKTNYTGKGIGESSTYYIWKAIGDLGHIALKADSLEVPDLILNIDGQLPVPKIPGIPYFYWETDSFFHGPHPEPQIFDQLFIGGCPEDLVNYPQGTVFLPHAFDEEIHRPHPETQKYDVVMIGSINHLYAERQRLVQVLQSHFNVFAEQSEFGKPYAKAMSRGKLIFNRSLGEKNIPMRFFEGMAIGCLLENYNDNLDFYAVPYEHYIPYTSDEDLVEKVADYLTNDKKRINLAKNARSHALKNHTYKHRVQTILGYL